MDISKVMKMYNPSELDSFFNNEVKNASWSGVFKYLLLGILLLSIGGLIQSLLISLMNPTMFPLNIGTMAISFVSGIVVDIIGFFVFCGIYYLIAKLLGGQGTAAEQLYLQAIAFFAVTPILLILGIISSFLISVSIVLCVIGVLEILILLYVLLFVTYKLIMVAHKVDSGKAMLIVVANIILWVIIAIILFVVFAAIFAALLSNISGSTIDSMPSNY